MKFFAVSKESKVSFALLALMYLLIITYTYICVLLKVPIEPETSKRPLVVRRSLGWRELLKTWDYNFKLKIESTGPSVFTYPDVVKFILNEVHACEEDFLVLALVVTAIQNHQRRHFIRHTWGHSAVVEKTGIKPLFIVGQPKQHTDQLSLEVESHQHHDILQANFIDDYQNLTYKTMAILHWASTSCPNVPLVLKIDDDVIPNPFALSDYLVSYLQRNPRPVLIMGKVRCCDPILRVGKWAVSEKEYNRSGYPPYVAGPSYIVPSAVIPALLQAAKKTRFLHLEDVYTTGLVAQTAGIGHKTIVSLTNSDSNKMKAHWCFGSKVFQENVGPVNAARGWNILRKIENISHPEAYILPENINS